MHSLFIEGHLGFLSALAIVGMPLMWTWGCFARTRVEVDDTGITKHTPFGKKHLYWYAVADYSGDETDDKFSVMGRDGKRMHFWSTLNGYEDLRAEIERYAPPPKTGWKTLK